MSGFQHDIAGGSGDLVATSVQSPNFVSGSTGWQVRKDGSAQFHDVTTTNGLDLVYNPSGGLGNLIASTAPAAGTDTYGNAYLAGVTSYGYSSPMGCWVAIQQFGQAIYFYTAPSEAGPWTLGPNIGQVGNAANPKLAINGSIGSEVNLNGNMVIVPPSGDNTGATDVSHINGLLSAGIGVQLLPAPLSAPYYIKSSILPVSQSRLWGAQWWSASANDNYSAGVGASGGSTIVMVPGFTGNAAISMVNATNTQYYGVDISGITIEGFEIPSGTVYGILVDGAWGACFLRGVCIHRPPADCIRFVTDSTSGFIPDDWLISECKFSASRNGYGVYASELADSWFRDCESSENALDGWLINYGVQTRFAGCKGENNSGNGFHFTGLGGNQVQYLTGCSTHINKMNGFLFDNSGPAGGGPDSTYVLTGCVAQQDGQGSVSAGYAGFASSGCVARVIATGCVSQVDSTGVYPQYGASEVSASYGMCFTGSLLQGATATHDDGSNTHALVNQSPVPF